MKECRMPLAELRTGKIRTYFKCILSEQQTSKNTYTDSVAKINNYARSGNNIFWGYWKGFQLETTWIWGYSWCGIKDARTIGLWPFGVNDPGPSGQWPRIMMAFGDSSIFVETRQASLLGFPCAPDPGWEKRIMMRFGVFAVFVENLKASLLDFRLPPASKGRHASFWDLEFLQFS